MLIDSENAGEGKVTKMTQTGTALVQRADQHRTFNRRRKWCLIFSLLLSISLISAGPATFSGQIQQVNANTTRII